MKKVLLSILLVSSIILPGISQATNGYWAHGYGPKSKSIAGACVAMSFGAMCAASNPASLAIAGNRLELGAALFIPERGFTANDDALPPSETGPRSIPPGRYESENDLFLIPYGAYNKMLDDDSSIGVAIGGNGGMNTQYDSPIFENFANPNDPSTTPSSTTGIDLSQLFAGITYSRKISERHSFGITPIFAVQSFEATGLQPFTSFSAHPDKVTDNGKDYAYGAGLKIGWLWRVNKHLNLAASYQSEILMSDFNDYKGLFADEGNFNVPQNYDVGFSYKINSDITFVFDFQHIDYASVSAMGNASDLVFTPGSIQLGTKDGLGYGWEDMDIVKLGLQWQFKPSLTLRAGYSHASDIFPESQALFNILSPAVIKEHYTFGFGKQIGSKNEINVAFMYAPNEKVSGLNPNTGPQTGFVEMEEWEIEVGWGRRF
jgi:long-chain fatty acid transport protein